MARVPGEHVGAVTLHVCACVMLQPHTKASPCFFDQLQGLPACGWSLPPQLPNELAHSV